MGIRLLEKSKWYLDLKQYPVGKIIGKKSVGVYFWQHGTVFW